MVNVSNMTIFHAHNILTIFYNFLVIFYFVSSTEVYFEPSKFIKLTLAISRSTYLPLQGKNRFVQNGHVMENPSTSDLQLLFGYIPLPPEYNPAEDNIACKVPGWTAKSYEDKETEVLLFMNTQQNLVVFGFRGTEPTNIEDWSTNFQFWSTQSRINNTTFSTHKGFKDRYHYISSWFEREYKAIPQDYIIVLTGHSSGGAQATIAAVYAAVNTKRKPDIVVTYGSPKVGEQNFAKLYENVVGCDRTIRMAATLDPVTYVPYFGYYHVCNGTNIDGGLNLIRAHSLYSGYNDGIEEKYKNVNTINFGCDQTLTAA